MGKSTEVQPQAVDRRKAALYQCGVIALLIIVPLIVFSPVTHYEFVWDDAMNITQNPMYQPAATAHIKELWTTPYDYIYIPVVRTLWAYLADAGTDAGGTPTSTFNPFKYHAANLIVHVLNVIMVFLILRRFVRSDRAAAFGGLVFAVHPLQVEPVAWVAGMRDLLSALFSFLAIYLYLRFAAPGAGKTAWIAFASAIACYIVSLLCKPTSAVTPLIAAILDWLAVNDATATASVDSSPKGGLTIPPARRLVALGAWLATSIPVAIATARIQPVDSAMPTVALWKRIFVMGDAYTFYIGKLFAPLSLGLDYGRTPSWLLSHSWAYAEILVPVALVAATAALAFRARIAWPLAATGIFLISLLPVSGIVPFRFQLYSTVTDRYAYFAMLSIALAAARVLDAVKPAAAYAVGAVAVGALTFLTVQQIPCWTNGDTLFTQGISVNPRSWMCYYNRGCGRRDHGDLDDAIADYRSTLVIYPGHSGAMMSIGMILESEWIKAGEPASGQAVIDEATADLESATKSDPANPIEHINLGCLYANTNRLNESVDQFHQALTLSPNNSFALSMLQSVTQHMQQIHYAGRL